MNAAARDPAQSGEGFSFEDVHRRLPLVRSIVADIQRLHGDLLERRDRLSRVRRVPGKKQTESDIYEDELREIERGIEQDEATLVGYIDELDNLGGMLCDAESGRVEFVGRMDGRPVYWGLDFGEGASSYWRDPESDDDERHSLVERMITEESDSA